MKNVCLLGATGSIGTQVLDLIRERNDEYNLVSMSFNTNFEKAQEIIDEFHPILVCSYSGINDSFRLKNPNLKIVTGDEGLIKVANFDADNPIVVNSLVGSVGLLPTVKAIEDGRDVYLANKETLVIGGEIVMAKAEEYGVEIIPIDSEHSAIKQIIDGRCHDDIKRLIITASGGSFRDLKREELVNVTKEDALKHPNWHMGAKITIDSATMMNKGFELIEAHYLFNIPMEQIEPILHRESIVHSMVEFKDGSIFAQIGSSDMHLPIKYALEGPRHTASSCIEPLSLTKLSNLHFEVLDTERYPMVTYAIAAIKKGGIYPTILNAANEAAVHLFLKGEIKFLDIERIVKESLANPKYQIYTNEELTLDLILKVDKIVKEDVLHGNI